MPNKSDPGELAKSLLGQKINVKIEKLVVGGAGLARHNGLVVFVDESAPGDELTVEIIEHKKNLAFAKIITIISPSALRVRPKCPHYGVCGGCNWQHLSIESQHNEKQKLLSTLIQKLKLPQYPELRPLITCPPYFNYRNRVQMTFTGKKLAFHAKRSHELVAIDACDLVEEPLAEFIKNPSSLKLKSDTRYELALDVNTLKGSLTEITEEEKGARFSQVNRFINQILIDHVVRSLDVSNSGRVIELYAGSGNFTFPILEKFKNVPLIAVEGSAHLVTLGKSKQNSLKISPKKLVFALGDVEHFLKTDWPSTEDSVFLDPPRGGASEMTIKTLAHSRPRQILYLSCHPVTLMRDLEILLKIEPRYQIQFFQGFDMFPQTDHVECLVSLKLTEI